MESFHVVLPSNSPGEGNQTSNFNVRLPDSLELDSNWTVALSSIIYPNSFLKSLSDDENYIIIHYVDTTRTPKKITIPIQNYATVQSLEKGLKDTCVHLLDLIPHTSNVRKRRAGGQRTEISPEFEESQTPITHEKSPEIENKEKSPEIESRQKPSVVTQPSRPSQPTQTPAQKEKPAKPTQHGNAQKSDQKEKSPDIEHRKDTKEKSPEFESNLKNLSNNSQHVSENLSLQNTQNEIANLQKRLTEEIKRADSYKTFALHQQIARLPNPMALQVNSGPFEIEEEKAKEIYEVLFKKFFIFEYQSLVQRFQLKLHNIYISHIEISQGLAYILGYEKNLIYRNDIAKYSPDPAGEIRELYVYAPNLIENSIVGNIKAPLLRITNIQGAWGETVECIYTLEQHHKLLTKRISEIQIEIRSFDGRLINFNFGNCILILHFMRNLFLA